MFLKKLFYLILVVCVTGITGTNITWGSAELAEFKEEVDVSKSSLQSVLAYAPRPEGTISCCCC